MRVRRGGGRWRRDAVLVRGSGAGGVRAEPPRDREEPHDHHGRGGQGRKSAAERRELGGDEEVVVQVPRVPKVPRVPSLPKAQGV